MPSIHRRRGWEVPEREVTPERYFWNRREVLKAMGFTGIGLAGGLLPGHPRPPGEAARAGPLPGQAQSQVHP